MFHIVVSVDWFGADVAFLGRSTWSKIAKEHSRDVQSMCVDRFDFLHDLTLDNNKNISLESCDRGQQFFDSNYLLYKRKRIPKWCPRENCSMPRIRSGRLELLPNLSDKARNTNEPTPPSPITIASKVFSIIPATHSSVAVTVVQKQSVDRVSWRPPMTRLYVRTMYGWRLSDGDEMSGWFIFSSCCTCVMSAGPRGHEA